MGLLSFVPSLAARPNRGARASGAFFALCCALLPLSTACHLDTGTGKSAIGIVGSGIVNDPGNKSLRFDILRFGIQEFCRELLQNGTPLRVQDDQPVIGRFFADSCQAQSLDDPGRHTVLVQFGGKGYAWTVGTGRLGFRAQGLLELAPDFRLHEDSLYVYFRPVHVDTSDFELLLTERPLAQAALELTRIDENELGRAIIAAQLGRGFTVIRYDSDGHTDFGLGLLALGERPFRPFTIVSSPRRTVANGRTELYEGQQDYLGRVHVNAGEELTLTLRTEGAPAVDVVVAPANDSSLIDRYVSQEGAAPRPANAIFEAQASSVAPFRAVLRPAPGDYYVIFDHSSALGTTTPRGVLPARVDYLVQAGSAP